MPRHEDRHYRVLVVSSRDQFDSYIADTMPSGMNMTADIKRNASAARRLLLEREYDIIIINMPLSDETGIELALDTVNTCQVLLVTPKEIFDEVLDRVTDYGVIVMPDGSNVHRMEKILRYLIAESNKIKKFQKQIADVQDKMDQMRLVNKAKFMLVEEKHVSEDEAHRMIGKLAMDNGISRGKAAQMIIDDLE